MNATPLAASSASMPPTATPLSPQHLGMTDHVDRPGTDGFDLDRALQAIVDGVRRLEEGLAQGRIAAELADPALQAAVGPMLGKVYTDLAAGPRRPRTGPRRHASIDGLLAHTKNRLGTVHRTYPAELLTRPTADGELPGPVRLRVQAPDLELRLDQVIAARYWRIGFSFANAGDDALLLRALLREATRNLAANLVDMTRILDRIGDDERFPPLVPTTQAFEQLMLDILNEPRRAASEAPLDADYSQKTDLRYETERGLGRRRGARVQVTSLTDFALHDEKVARITFRDKFVILSPIELARWIDAETHRRGPFLEPLDKDLLRRVWECLAPAYTTSDLARVIGRRFETALHTQTTTPLGPLGNVPVALRELVRAWVDRSAVRSTRQLRAFESRFGQQQNLPDGRLSRRFAKPSTTPEATWREFCKSYVPGTEVEVRVAQRADHAVWAWTAEGIEVFVLCGEEPLPNPGERLSVRLLDRSDEHRWITAVPLGADPERVLHAAKSKRRHTPHLDRGIEAWNHEVASTLVVGSRHRGSVRRTLYCGLIVEVVPGVCGLLHVSRLGGRSPRDFPGELEVRIVSLDLDRARMELDLAEQDGGTADQTP